MVLTWENPGNAGITGYEVRYEVSTSALPETWDAIEGSDGNTTSHEITGLTNGTRYTLEVRAENAAGAGAAARLTAAPGVPRVPEDLVWSQGQGSVGLAWTDPDNAAITGYQIRYRDGDEWNPDWTAIPSSDATTTSHTVAGLTNVTSYTFEVRAVSAAGPGAPAGVMPMTPKAPGMLRASPGVNEVTLTWSDPRDPSIRGYEFHSYSGSAPTQPAWTEIPDSGAGTTEHTVAGLTNGTSYTFELRAKNSAGPGPSASVTATPFPGPPANLEATAGVGQATLSWADPGDAAIDVYQLRYGEAGGALSSWHDISGSGAATTEHRVTELTNGAAYTFRLRAKASATPGDSSVATATPYPAAPAGLGTTAGVNQVRLDWHESGDASVTAYQLIYYSGGRPSQPAWNDIPGSGAGTTDHVVTGLTNGTTYTFEVRAAAGAVYGDSSVAMDTPVPGAPAGLTGLSRDGSVVLSWDDPGDAAIDRYQVRHAESGVALPGWRERHYVAGAGTTEHPVTELTNGTDYTFEVRARAGAVHGAAAEVTAMAGCPAITVSGLGDTTVTAGADVSLSVRAAGGCGAITYAMSGAPEDVEIDENSGAVTGPAAPAGAYEVTVTATDAAGNTGEGQFTITVECPAIGVEGLRDTSLTVGAPIENIQARGSGSQASYWYSISSDPAEGITLSIGERNGNITGTTAAAGTYTVTVTVRDDHGCTGRGTFTITAQCGEITYSGPATVTVQAGGSRTATAAADGGRPPYTFTKTSGPDWITIRDERTITVTNAPGSPGTSYRVDVGIRDVHGCTGTGSFNVAIDACPDVTVSGLRAVTVAVDGEVSLTATAQGGGGGYTYSLSIHPESGLDLEIDATSGSITGTARRPDTYTVRVFARARGAPDTCPPGKRSFTVEVPCPGIAIADIRSFEEEVNQTFSRTATVSGGCGTKSSSREDGPEWVEHRIDAGNLIVHGTAPSTPGTHPVRMRVRDTGDAGNYDDEEFTITVVNPQPPLGIMCSADTSLTVGGSIKRTASAWEGVAPYTFSPLSVKPSGLSLTLSATGQDGDKGTVTGEAAPEGVYRVTVTVRDSDGASESCGFNVTVRRRPCPTIEVSAGGNMTVKAGSSIRRTATATGSGGSHGFSLSVTPSSGQDLSIGGTNGEISGNVLQAGTYTVTVYARATGASSHCTPGSDSFTITVLDGPGLTCPANQTVKPGASISVMPTVSGGTTPYTWSISQSSGLDLSISSSGTITGTAPSTPGTYTVTVTVTDNNDITASCTFTIKVLDEPELTCPANQTVKPGASISVTPTVSGGTTPYTWSISQSSGWICPFHPAGPSPVRRRQRRGRIR